MFVGHLGAGLAAKRLAPSVNLGVLFLAAMGLDALLWIFVLLGLEAIHVPENFEKAHYLTFTFPYSHGLVSSLAWSVAALAVARSLGWRATAGLVVAGTVFSHFVLDALVHVVGLPLLGSESYHLGLGLWRHPAVELPLEGAIGVFGWWLYVRTPGSARGGARWALGAVVVLCGLMTMMGALATEPPPRPAIMATASLATIAIVSFLAGWLDRRGSST